MNIYMVGIGGVGMGNLASLLKQAGHHVRGSDAQIFPPMSDFLKEQGIAYQIGFSAEHISDDIEIAVIGNVARADNVEVVELKRRALPMLSMPQAIRKMLLPGHESIVISGTHGKTTTTAMATFCLRCAGYDPGFLVGGIANDLGTGSGLGSQSQKLPRKFFVLEGDEYDSAFFQKEPKFLSYEPKYLIITSLEFDHADIYTDLASITHQFEKLVALVPKNGLILVCSDYPEAVSVCKQATAKVLTYGTRAQDDFIIQTHATTASASSFALSNRQAQKQYRFSLKLSGDYNISNAAAVAALMLNLGLSESQIRNGLAGFSGVRRRQQMLYESANLCIMEDFAHHPTAITVTLKGLRQGYPGHELWTCFEPRSNTTRRNFFQDSLPAALAIADRVLFYKVYNALAIPEAQRLNRQKIAKDIQQAGGDCQLVDTVEDLVALIQPPPRGQKPRLVVIMTNGDFDGLKPLLAKRFVFSGSTDNAAE